MWLTHKDGLLVRTVFVSLVVTRAQHVSGPTTIRRRSCRETAFVSLVISRGGHVIWGFKIQRQSYPQTRLCIINDLRVQTRHNFRHWDTKTVLWKDLSLYRWWFHMEATWFEPLKYKDGLILKPIFVCLLGTRGGVPLYCHTKMVLTKTHLCILNGFTWRARAFSFLTLPRASKVDYHRTHNYVPYLQRNFAHLSNVCI